MQILQRSLFHISLRWKGRFQVNPQIYLTIHKGKNSVVLYLDLDKSHGPQYNAGNIFISRTQLESHERT